MGTLTPRLLAAAVSILASAITVQPHAAILEGTPDAIVCSVKDPTGALPWVKLVFYASARTADHRTLYKTLTSDPVVLFVSETGRVDAPNLADCDGQSISALLERGQAIDLTR